MTIPNIATFDHGTNDGCLPDKRWEVNSKGIGNPPVISGKNPASRFSQIIVIWLSIDNPSLPCDNAPRKSPTLTVPSLKLTARPWKWMVGIRSFPFGMAYFQGLWLLVSGWVTSCFFFVDFVGFRLERFDRCWMELPPSQDAGSWPPGWHEPFSGSGISINNFIYHCYWEGATPKIDVRIMFTTYVGTTAGKLGERYRLIPLWRLSNFYGQKSKPRWVLDGLLHIYFRKSSNWNTFVTDSLQFEDPIF